MSTEETNGSTIWNRQKDIAILKKQIGRIGSCTGKSLSEALIFASTNPQLFIELRVQYMKITSCGLVDARIGASEKDLPVQAKV